MRWTIQRYGRCKLIASCESYVEHVGHVGWTTIDTKVVLNAVVCTGKMVGARPPLTPWPVEKWRRGDGSVLRRVCGVSYHETFCDYCCSMISIIVVLVRSDTARYGTVRYREGTVQYRTVR